MFSSSKQTTTREGRSYIPTATSIVGNSIEDANAENLRCDGETTRTYQVSLPPGPGGVCFETVFNPEGIVVQKMKPRSYAADQTALAVGDQLVAINDTSTEGIHFDDAMNLLLGFQKSQGCTLTLRTVQEQWRSLRQEALRRLGEGEGETASNRGSGGGSGDCDCGGGGGGGVKMIELSHI